MQEIGLPRPGRELNTPRNPTSGDVMEKLHNRRAGIEPLIGHLKRNWQMGRSRMKSGRTTLSAGYAAVLGFNLRQLKRYAMGKAIPPPTAFIKQSTDNQTVDQLKSILNSQKPTKTTPEAISNNLVLTETAVKTSD